MSEAARTWLATHADDVPAQLQQRLEEAAAAAGAQPTIAGELAAAAVDCLRVAVQHCDERGAAVHLLAADALVTHACALAADAGADALHALARDLTAVRLHALFAPPGA